MSVLAILLVLFFLLLLIRGALREVRKPYSERKPYLQLVSRLGNKEAEEKLTEMRFTEKVNVIAGLVLMLVALIVVAVVAT